MWAQVDTVRRLSPSTVLEVGLGNGFVAHVLRQCGYNVVTFDINVALEPDVVGSVDQMEPHFREGSFDLVLCAEVLEHLPLATLPVALSQLARVTRKWAVITLPTCRQPRFAMAGNLRVPILGVFDIRLGALARRKAIAREHHWELESQSESRVVSIVSLMEIHFVVESYGAVTHNPYHCVFTLRKRPCATLACS